MASQEEEDAQRLSFIGNKCVFDIDRSRVGNFPLKPTTLLDLDDIPSGCVAANKNFICFALDSGSIRVVSKKNVSMGCFLEGINGSVTDMVFFSQDVDLLASITSDGLLYVWRILRGRDKELSQNIKGCKVLAVRIKGESDTVYSRICWNSRKEDALAVGIGRSILRFNIPKIKSRIFYIYSNHDPEVTRQSPGVHYVGEHEAEVTGLSMCWKGKSLLVSSANDGTIKLWEEASVKPIAELRLGKAIFSASFLTSPYCPEHIILVTGASSSVPQKEVEVKLWTSIEDGRLGTKAGELWHCMQTLVFTSSARADDLLLNKVLAIPQTGLMLLADAKVKTVYAIHLEYGHNPAATHMDYITKFTISEPNLSFTVFGGKEIVHLYCVLTRAINQYELDISRCLPPPTESLSLALPARTTEETVQQLQYFQKALSRVITMQEGMDNKITKMEEVQKEIQKQIAGQLFFHQPLALVVGDILNSALSTMVDKTTSSIPDSQDDHPISLVLKRELNSMILNSDYENAFTRALKEGHAAVCWLCTQVDISNLMKREKIPLGRDALSGLLKHFSSQISTSSFPQIMWMKDIALAAKELEPNDTLFQVSSILEEACEMMLMTKLFLQNKDGT